MTTWAYDASAECVAHGCQHHRLVEATMTEVQRRIGEAKMARYTQALWCDFGKHPFSERDFNKRALTMMGEVDGETVEETWTACGNHVPNSPSQIVNGELEP